MPIYVYRATAKRNCTYCREGFEILQRLKDQPLEECPRCSAAIAKEIRAANLASSSVSLDSDKLEKHGFTQYRKLEKGVYEKTAGKGPPVISDKDS